MGLTRLGKVIVETEYGIRTVDLPMARILAIATNAEVFRARDGRMVRVILRNHTSGDPPPGRYGNPQKDIHNAESETNPPRVWEFKGFLRQHRIRVETA